MNDAALEPLALLVSWATSSAVVFAVTARDMRRASGIRAARGWPRATRCVAAVVFGPLSLPLHFVRTRRNALGLLLGLAWGAAASLAGAVLANAATHVVGSLLGDSSP